MISAYVHPYSNVLNMETDVRLILPDPDEDKRPLPCIYLCHGGSGDEDAWLYFGGIGELADNCRTAFCLVNAQDSCFTDMAHGFPFASYIGKKLPSSCGASFPVFPLTGRIPLSAASPTEAMGPC